MDDAAAQALEEAIAGDERGSEMTSRRPNVQTSVPPDAGGQKLRPPKPPGAGVAWREGRLTADGTRRGAGWVRRMTVYLPPDLAMKLDLRAAELGEDKSALIAEAVARLLEADA